MNAEAIASRAYKLCKCKLDSDGRKASALIDEATGGHALSWALTAALYRCDRLEKAANRVLQSNPYNHSQIDLAMEDLRNALESDHG